MLAKTTVIAVTAIITPPMPWDFGSTVPICIDHPYEAANCGALKMKTYVPQAPKRSVTNMRMTFRN